MASSGSGARRPGRPADPDKRAAIVEAAWELFLERGVEAVAMEAIATRAAVSKVTLYRYFPDRDLLLEAGVLAEMERIEAAQNLTNRPPRASSTPAEPPPLEQQLRAFGLGIMHFLASSTAIDFYAHLAGDLRRHPDLARRFWDAGPGRTRRNLIAVLEHARDAGELQIDDAAVAADQLFGMWQGFTNLQYALGVPDDVGVQRRVDDGVQRFLAAHSTSTSRDAIRGSAAARSRDRA